MRYSFFLVLFFSLGSLIAQNYTIHGVVRDSATGEALIGAGVVIKELDTGTATNNYGFYSISLKGGQYTVCGSYLGYLPYFSVINIKSDTLLSINLSTRKTQLEQINVKGGYSKVESLGTSKNVINATKVKAITSISGEPDVLKSLQLLPGVQTSNEGSANLNVRGGSFDQNLILLDEAPVYNPSHSLGFFSTFNADAINNITFYKGCYPAQYGGRLSSVVDIQMKEGNNKTFHANGGIGLVASRLTLEGPLVRNKASFIVSGRYSYAGKVANLFGKLGKELNIYELNNFSDKNEVSFFDINAKINYQVNDNNRAYFSLYAGGDHFYSYALNNDNKLDWGNRTATLRWNHIFSSKLFSNFTLYHSKYNYSYYIENDLQNYIWKSSIFETGIKNDYSYYSSSAGTFKFGFNAINRAFEPGRVEPRNTQSLIKPVKLDKKNSNELSVYIEDEFQLTSFLSAGLGARHTLFFDLGPSVVYNYSPYDSVVYNKNEMVKFYQGFEPRASLRCFINRANSVKLSYAHVYQYLHLLSNSSAGLPTDTWIPADKHIKPQSSHQFVLGYYSSVINDDYLITLENYYKTMDNVIDFKDNADLFLNKHIETEILQGNGYSYGTELMIEKKLGKLNGWVAYTLNKTQYKIEGINNGIYYSPRYDIRHNLSIVAQYNLTRKWSISSTFKLTSGGFITLPEGSFIYNHIAFQYYNGRNGYKLPAYHRLDVSINYKSLPKNDKRFKSEWNLGIYNIYNHKNIYAVFVRQNDNNFSESKASAMYLFGIVPTLTYNFYF